MYQQQQIYQQVQYNVKAKFKNDLITDIFSQISKNVKDVNHFFIVCEHKEMKLVFMDQSKSMQIQLTLPFDCFTSYSWGDAENQEAFHGSLHIKGQEKAVIRKFSLKDFVDMTYFFELSNSYIDMTVCLEYVQFESKNFNGISSFRVSALSIDEDEQQSLSDLLSSFTLGEPKVKVQLKRLSPLDDILHTFKLFRVETINFDYKTNEKHLVITSGDQAIAHNGKISFNLKVTQKQQCTFCQFKYSFKKLKAGFGLVSKDSLTTLKFYENVLEVSLKQKSNKEVTMKISASI